MLPTPSTSHLSFARIYEPAEDTYLLLDTLSSARETAFLRARFSPPRRRTPPPLLLEVGAGSGAVLAFLAAHSRAILGRADAAALATDVNEHACWAARDTVRLALAAAGGAGEGEEEGAGGGGGRRPGGGSGAATTHLLASLTADLAAPLRPRTVDLLVFNPPYVPTDPTTESPAAIRARLASPPPSPPPPTLSSPVCYLPRFSARDADLLALAYAGGLDGMETSARLLAELDGLLDPVRGVAYVLLCARNRPADVAARIRRGEWGAGWAVESVGHSGGRAGWEVLQVLRIWRAGVD
jgi:release factor glutamine methyltransferase